MRVLVCGGRDYSNRSLVHHWLSALHSEKGISCIIQGGARGADYYAREFSALAWVPLETYRAEWARYGRAAGPTRNQRMIDEAEPDLVLAFDGGPGTQDMVDRASKAGVATKEIDRS